MNIIAEERLGQWALCDTQKLVGLFEHEAVYQWENGSRGVFRDINGARTMTLPEFVGQYIQMKWLDFAGRN